MSKVIALIQLVLQITPMLITAMKAIEAAMPEGGKGKDKLAMLRAAVEAAFETVDGAQVSFQEAWPTIERTINGFVAIFNSSGIFRK